MAQLRTLTSCAIEPEVRDSEGSIKVEIWKQGKENGTLKLRSLGEVVYIPLNNLMIDFKGLKERRAYKEMLLSRFYQS